MVWRPDYLTLAEGKAALRLTDTADDALIPAWITAASRAIDDRCNRQFGQEAAPVARVYRRCAVWNDDLGLFVQDIDDLQDTAGFLVGGVAYGTSGAVLLPENAAVDGMPYTRLGFTTAPDLSVAASRTHTGRWGWTTFPAGVITAARLILARIEWRRGAPQGVAGSPDQGSEVRLLAKLDPDAIMALKGLSRPRWGG